MKIVLVGYGNMGKDFETLATAANHQIVAIKGKTIGEDQDFSDVGDFDVLIDFSHPSFLKAILDFLLARNRPGVICTTGLNEEQKKMIEQASQKIPILYSRNISIAISIMKKIVRDINKALNYDFDIEIVETHHKHKLDAPSGTALMLAEALKEDHHYNVIQREHLLQRRNKEDLAIHSIRGGGSIGEHSVLFFGDDEYIEIKHVALSRKLFCQGALKAAQFIIKQKNGLYSVDDIITEK